MSIPEFLRQTYFDNTVQQYLLFGLFLLLGLVFKSIIVGYLGGILFRLLGKSANEIGRPTFDERLRKPLNNLVFFGAVFLAAQQLNFPENWNIASEDEFGLRMI